MQVQGTIKDIRFRNEDNQYTVASLDTEDGNIIITGVFPPIKEGESVIVDGDMIYHPKYGEQIKVLRLEKNLPQGTEAMEKYLSMALPHVGKKTAHLIVERFQEETEDVLRNHPERLREIPGIGDVKLRGIMESLEESFGSYRAMMYLSNLGISMGYAKTIYEKYGEETITRVDENPYQLIDDVRGIGFATADRIAFKKGIFLRSEYRIEAGTSYYIKKESSAGGHCFIPEEELIEGVARLLGIEKDLVARHMDWMILRSTIKRDTLDGESVIYPYPLYKAEMRVANRIARMLMATVRDLDMDYNEAIEDIEEARGIKFASEQRDAISASVESGLLVITGGPGTGKTTVIKAVVDLFEKNAYNIALAAPTGRAAKRMEEATGREAQTIHRLLGYKPLEFPMTFEYNEESPLPFDLIIVDEFSMVDIELMENLMDAVGEGTRLIFIGDTDQLPSVGPGNVLKDIIRSQRVRTIRLETVFRQGDDSNIVTNAHRINRGLLPLVNEEGKDFFFIKSPGNLPAQRLVVDLVTNRLPNFYGMESSDIQVLCPMKKGEVGIDALNEVLQARLNPSRAEEDPIEDGPREFRKGDRVMQTKNNYNASFRDAHGKEGLGIYNGDMGFIAEIDQEEHIVEVEFEDGKRVQYPFKDLGELLHSYAITIHKSQGSEFPCVLIPLFPGPPMLFNRNLIYTAITRAKKLVVLVGDPQVLRTMIDNNQVGQRNSALDRRILYCLERLQEGL